MARAADHAVPVTGQHVDDPRRDAGLFGESRQCQRGERRQLGGLEHHGVAHGDGRSDLPAGGEQRRIPGRDLQHYTDRLTPRVVEVRSRYWDDLAMQLVGPAGVILEHFCHFHGLATAIADRFTRTDRLQACQLFGAATNALANREHQAAALGMGHRPPACLPFTGRRHGGFGGLSTTVGVGQAVLTAGGLLEADRLGATGLQMPSDVGAHRLPFGEEHSKGIDDFLLGAVHGCSS